MWRLTRREKAFTFINSSLLAIFAFVCAYPLWYIVVLSFNEGRDASLGGIFWWPRVFTMDNFRVILNDHTIVNAFWITVARTAIGTTGSLLITSMVAYGLSRKELPGRNQLLLVFLFVMLFNGGLIPFYLQLVHLKLINNFWVYVLPGLFSIWNMFVMKTSFQNTIPEAVVESMKLDGAGYTRIYFNIVLPFSMPLFAALGLFTAVGHWNDWFTGAFFVNDLNLQPLPTYLQRIMSTIEASQMISASQMASAHSVSLYNPDAITSKSVRMATIVITILPILFVYPFVQRFFVKGVLIGSVKE
ncbi:putative aldouronate transport system permease protein [Paenibacillus taihuensis]|uniref:Putative aldouronate transport system permease protein n=1 Tax=Paenibacillus taihuensis TaxID=1156355 RepID=A0A3D9R1X9_9BACL|nr:carbohydrate ABC transporter permease [Paenibacillus taihuensis]REE68733.1 putative aldouronate transport system permease protein [Paenibacillus taihuensis]